MRDGKLAGFDQKIPALQVAQKHARIGGPLRYSPRARALVPHGPVIETGVDFITGIAKRLDRTGNDSPGTAFHAKVPLTVGVCLQGCLRDHAAEALVGTE